MVAPVDTALALMADSVTACVTAPFTAVFVTALATGATFQLIVTVAAADVRLLLSVTV